MAPKRKKPAKSRGGVKLFHPEKWTVVTEEPGEPCDIIRFADQVGADEFLYRIRSVGNGNHSTILPPALSFRRPNGRK